MNYEQFTSFLPWLLLIVVIIFVAEFGCYLLYRLLFPDGQKQVDDIFAKRYNVSYDALRKELSFLTDHAFFHPYRWHSFAPFTGRYFQTDHHGWRVDGDKRHDKFSGDRVKIACFGGSTMMAVIDNEGTIPFHLNSRLNTDRIIALNYGGAGYSSTTELISLIEVMRYEDDIRYAVFYDGVNEVTRYFDYKKNNGNNTIFSVLGHPYSFQLDKAMRNYLRKSHVGRSIHVPYSLKLAKRLTFTLLPRSITSRETITDYDAEAEIIARIYVANVRDIDGLCKARNIVPIFLLEPNIYTADSKILTDRQKRIVNHQYFSVDLPRLFKGAYDKIANNDQLRTKNFYDISDCLNNSPKDDYYLDYCHLFGNGTKIVADKILSILDDYMPQSYFK